MKKIVVRCGMCTIPAVLLGVLAIAAAEPTDAAKAKQQSTPSAPMGARTMPATTAEFTLVTLEGKVVRYKEALKRLFQLELAGQWGDKLLALETADGRLLPILPTDSGRFFYQDVEMQNRRMEIIGRVYAKTPGLQVIDVHSFKDGKRHAIYYWCSICGIKLYQLQDCDCCQGPLEVIEEPLEEEKKREDKP